MISNNISFQKFKYYIHLIFIFIIINFIIQSPSISQVKEEWIARYNGPGDLDDSVYDMTIDISGNVYVTGYSVGSGTNADYATIKYSQGTFSECFHLY